MAVSVRFARLVMPVFLTKRTEFLKPFVNILDQSLFCVVDIDAGCNMHGRNERDTFLDSAFCDEVFDFFCDVKVLAVFLGLKPKVFGVDFHVAESLKVSEISGLF